MPELRDVQFQSLEGFLDELEYAASIGGQSAPECLRIDVDIDDTQSGRTSYAVIAGFTQEGWLRELHLDCGTDYHGCGQDAKARVEEIVNKLTEAATQLGVRVAGGAYSSR